MASNRVAYLGIVFAGLIMNLGACSASRDAPVGPPKAGLGGAGRWSPGDGRFGMTEVAAPATDLDRDAADFRGLGVAGTAQGASINGLGFGFGGGGGIAVGGRGGIDVGGGAGGGVGFTGGKRPLPIPPVTEAPGTRAHPNPPGRTLSPQSPVTHHDPPPQTVPATEPSPDDIPTITDVGSWSGSALDPIQG